MSKQKRTGPAQADEIEQPQERSPARKKDQSRKEKSKDNLPGADSKNSAAASEDTYD